MGRSKAAAAPAKSKKRSAKEQEEPEAAVDESKPPAQKRGKKGAAAAAGAAPAAAAAADEAKPKQHKQQSKKKQKEEKEAPPPAPAPAEGEDEDDYLDNSPMGLFERDLEDRSAVTGMWVCIVPPAGGVPEEDEEDEEEVDEAEAKNRRLQRLQKSTRLWLPKYTDYIYNNLLQELRQIGASPPESEDDDEEDEAAAGGMSKEMRRMLMQAMGIRMLNTQDSYPMQALIKQSLKEVDKEIKAKDWQEAFSVFVATLLASNDEMHWYADTDAPGEVDAILKQMRKQWGVLKKRSLQELGDFCAETGPEDTQIDGKAEIDRLLQRLTDDASQFV